MSKYEFNNKPLLAAKLIQVSLLAAILIYVDILYRWSIVSSISQDIGFDKSTLDQVTFLVALIGVISLVLGYFFPGLMTNINKQKSKPKFSKRLPFQLNMTRAESVSLSIQIIRAAAFSAVAVCGLMLGLFGVSWKISLPFFVTAAVSLVLTFPTKKRWNIMLEKFNENIPPAITKSKS